MCRKFIILLARTYRNTLWSISFQKYCKTPSEVKRRGEFKPSRLGLNSLFTSSEPNFELIKLKLNCRLTKTSKFVFFIFPNNFFSFLILLSTISKNLNLRLNCYKFKSNSNGSLFEFITIGTHPLLLNKKSIIPLFVFQHISRYY